MSLNANGQTDLGKDATGFLNSLIGQEKKGALLKPRSLGEFVFSYLERVDTELTASITDHWSEDGTAIHQNATKHPVKIRMRGFVTDLTLNIPSYLNSINTLSNAIDKKISAVAGLTAPLSTGMMQTYNKAQSATTEFLNEAERVTQGVKNFLDVFDIKKGEKRSIKAYKELKTLFEQGTPFTIIPFNDTHTVYKNMLIERVRLTQKEEEPGTLEITIECKQVHIVSTDKNILFIAQATKINRLEMKKVATHLSKGAK